MNYIKKVSEFVKSDWEKTNGKRLVVVAYLGLVSFFIVISIHLAYSKDAVYFTVAFWQIMYGIYWFLLVQKLEDVAFWKDLSEDWMGEAREKHGRRRGDVTPS